MPFCVEGLDKSAVVVSHLGKLRRNLPWKLHTLLQGRVGFESFAFDFLKKVGTATQELVMREFPCLDIRRGALGARCLDARVKLCLPRKSH